MKQPSFKNIATETHDVAYLRWGDPNHPKVIMVHGFPDTARTWDVVGPKIADEGFDVIAFNTRGYAPTAVPKDGKYDSDTLGTDIIRLLDAFEIEKAIVVGHDWGASAVYSAAGLFPERLEKMIAVAIPHPASVKLRPALIWGTRHFVLYKLPGATKRFSKNNFEGLRTVYKRWSPDFEWPESEFDAVIESFSDPASLDAAFEYYRQLQPAPPTGQRKKISVPSLVIGGLNDGVATESDFRNTTSRFTGPIEVEMVPGGHFLHREFPDDFLAVLIPFLKR